ncbi:hypothetical protein LTR05_008015 [Lithohypha guttulata]|uniref:Uncharacterized protein n=1 Tax=Lithohypha guttulata TaxID=1690604 RepID=A0AAN7STT6_9EURO|nr:hypothetical protein LTR05_008015 [Lithohypha guttulata]
MASWKIKGYVSDSEDEDEDAYNKNTIVHQHDGLLQLSQKRISTITAVETNAVNSVSSENVPKKSENNHTVQYQCSTDRADCLPSTSQNTGQAVVRLAGSQQLTSQNDVASTAEKLEKSISEGLSLVRDVLAFSTQSPRPQSSVTELDESPLSTPPDSPSSSQKLIEAVPFTTPTAVAVLSQPYDQLVPNPTSSIRRGDLHQVPQRNFRTRKANQINPYSLEWARYLKQCNERGIKPVRIANPPSLSRSIQADETQASSFEDDSQQQESMEPEASIAYAPGNLNKGPTDLIIPSSPTDLNNADAALETEDLPDLDLLMQKTYHKNSRTTCRTSKVHKPDRLVLENSENVYDLPSSGEESRRNKPSRPHYSAQIQCDSLPSPPRSMSVDSTDPLLLPEKSVHISSQDVLPTPLLSSAPRRNRWVVEDDTQSSPENDQARQMSESAESNSSDTDADNSKTVRIMQKKVKGVLPASWWNIARARQEVVAEKREMVQKSLRKDDRAGVAQHKTRPTPLRTTQVERNPDEDLLSEESSEEMVKSPLKHFAPRSSARSAVMTPAAWDGEATEVFDDDAIDPMLPVRERINTASRKRKVNPHHPGIIKHRRYLSTDGMSMSRGRLESRPRSHQPHKRRHTTTTHDLVHVLDAPDLQASTTQRRPHFLRVAARRAKEKPHLRGTRASHKSVHLSDDANPDAVLQKLKTRTNSLLDNRTAQRNFQTTVVSPEEPHRIESNPGARPQQAKDVAQLPANALIIQCGRLEEHQLRLTRLRSLLPRSNRSGQGQFEHLFSVVRDAQAESPLLDARPRHPRSLVVSAAFPTSGQTAPQPLPKDGASRPALGMASTTEARPRKMRKQKPVHKPQLQQSLLASAAPDTQALEVLIGKTDPSVRAILEQEFAKHQPAWFQGSKTGICLANNSTQGHFYVFLQVLKSYLPMALQDADSDREMRELKSFVHRLIPNRASIGAQGQVGDKTHDVLEYDILVARNVFDLHTCLLSLTPTWAPLPRLLEMKVNFSHAHHEICLIALQAWRTIYDAHHSHPPVVQGLGSWLYTMFEQLLERWSSAEDDARNEALNSVHWISEEVIRKAIEHNRQQVTSMLTLTVSNLTRAANDAVSVMEIDLLFNFERYSAVLNTFSKTPDMDTTIICVLLEVCIVYAGQKLLSSRTSNSLPLLSGVRQALATVTSIDSLLDTKTYHAMVKAYFAVASLTVGRHEKSWDEFFEPTSSYSFDMFISQPHLQIMKTYFYHLLLEQDPSSYLMELRSPVLTHWLHVLLEPKHDLSISLLTASIFRHERDSLAMHTLTSKFYAPDSPVLEQDVFEAISEVRHAAVTHVIHYLHIHEHSSEAEWLMGGLDDGDSVRMLREMFSTMKVNWIALSEDPGEQDVYTILIHTALEQFEAYPRTDFKIDQWYFNPATFPQARKKSLGRLLDHEKNSNRDFTEEARELLNIEVKYALKHDRLQGLAHELKEVLLARPAQQSATMIANKRAVFIRDVLVPTLTGSDRYSKDVRLVVIGSLEHAVDNLECMFDATDIPAREIFLEAIIATSPAMVQVLANDDEEEKNLVYKLVRLLFEWSVATFEILPQGFINDDLPRICELAGIDSTEAALCLLHSVSQKA